MAIRSSLSSTFWVGKSNTSFPLNFCSDSTASARVLSSKIVCTISIDPENIKCRLIMKGFAPTPKIVHRLLEKQVQKAKRKAKKDGKEEILEYKKKILEEEALFEAASHEYAAIMDELGQEEFEGGNLPENFISDDSCNLKGKMIEIRKKEHRENSKGKQMPKMEGRPWERITNTKKKMEEVNIGRRRNGNVVSGHTLGRNESDDEEEHRRINRLQGGDLEEFGKMVLKCKKGDLSWLLDDDLGNDLADLKCKKGDLSWLDDDLGNDLADNTFSKSRKDLAARTPADEELQIQWLAERGICWIMYLTGYWCWV